VSIARRELKQEYPKPGWVEQDPEEIWTTQINAGRNAVSKSPRRGISAIAITNQRETTLFWDKRTLEPVCGAIVWQDRRGDEICEEYRRAGYSDLVRKKTGLVIDPYFSASKIRWLLDSSPKLRKRADRGEIHFGTVDTFLLSRLTNGSVHATDYTNASRTMLFDIERLCWDDELLKLFKIPRQILPEVYPSSHTFGESNEKYFGKKLSIEALIGDQQASLFGQAAFRRGLAKNTYGTGCFLLANTIRRISDPPDGLLSTIAWGLSGNDVTYALEGSVLVAGAGLQWLRDGLKMSWKSSYSRKLDSNDGVYFVPALTGLGAPYWDAAARGLIIGITRGTTGEHLFRSAIEAICYQTRDIFESLRHTVNFEIKVMRADGRGASNDFLMQFQSDILGIDIQRPTVTETTAAGAALLAGLSIGKWKNLDEIAKSWKLEKEFKPKMTNEESDRLYEKWKDAVSRSRSWART
jgi:glycerol kinase